jgi:hypothetical protein
MFPHVSADTIACIASRASIFGSQSESRWPAFLPGCQNALPLTAQGSLQIGGGCGGGAGCASRHRARIGSSVSFRQNLGAPMSFKHAPFQ